MPRRTRSVVEFGDFQTPPALAAGVCRLVAQRGFRPASVIEPTCGTGNFLLAAEHTFPDARAILGLEINADHVRSAEERTGRARIRQADFFRIDWAALLDELPEPVLVVGNPPWVTNAGLGALGSENLPTKDNPHRLTGLEALTGKSNFDISEWMLIRLLESIAGREAALAMLVKTAVARKTLAHAWRRAIRLGSAELHAIDARRWFEATVDAGLLLVRPSRTRSLRDCRLHPALGSPRSTGTIGWRDGRLVADVNRYRRWKHLIGPERRKWRSGIKHDAAKVMEFRRLDALLTNGLGETVDLEADHLFPLRKSSDLGKPPSDRPARRLLVTQRRIGEPTDPIRTAAPRTWRYLERHARRLEGRASAIYRGRPRFSIFGVGDYSFAPWKVAISGLYKRLQFEVLGPEDGKPVVLDDTVYFLPCETGAQAKFLVALLASEPAEAFYRAFIFWDNKRPITREVLAGLDLRALARELGRGETYERLFGGRRKGRWAEGPGMRDEG